MQRAGSGHLAGGGALRPARGFTVDEVVRGPGRPLPAPLRAQMEQRLGADFSDVRVHTGSAARASARELGASAYAFGRHLVFRRDGYDDGSAAGRETLAHELAHVIQQRRGAVAGRPAAGGPAVSEPGDAFERAAETTARRAMARTLPTAPAAVDPGSRSDPGSLMGGEHASGASVRPVVQRKMGLEFETGLPVRTDKGQELAYNDLVYRSTQHRGWEIKADSSNLEFVTDPQSSSQQLATTMDDMSDFAGDLARKMAADRIITVADLMHGEDQRNGTNRIGPLDPPTAMHAKPQATFGVPLENMVAMFHGAQTQKLPSYRAAAWTGRAEEVTLATSQHAAHLEIVDAGVLASQFRHQITLPLPTPPNPAQNAGIDRVTGLAALVFHELNDFWRDRSSGKAPYAKAVLSVLHRTDFRSMYNSLQHFEKQFFTPETIADIWWQEPGTPEAKLAKMGALTTNMAAFGEKKEVSHKGYPLDDWLKSIVGGSVRPEVTKDAVKWDREHEDGASRGNKDLMSRGAVAHNSRSLGLLGMDTDPQFDKRSLAVVEFRELANRPPLSWQTWPRFAYEMYKLYQEVNNLP